MKTTIITISKENNYRYTTSREDFRRMRMFMFRCVKLDRISIHQLADLFDKIWELPVGDEVYFCASDYELYKKPTKEELQDSLNRMQEFSEKEKNEHYAPHWWSIWTIKRTAKCFILKSLDYDWR